MISPLLDDTAAEDIGLGYQQPTRDQRDEMVKSFRGHSKWLYCPLPEDHLPLRYYAFKGNWHGRAFARGPMSMDLLVSSELRDLWAELDPTAVHFEPVELTLRDGTVLKDRYWVPKVTRTLDALVPEKSAVTRRISRVDGAPLGWGYLKNIPPTLNRAVVDGHHIWRLSNLSPYDIFVSDRMKVEMDRRGLGPFSARQAPLD
ncbi:MAG: DUF1629 domain-containing protein [Paracoccaceae bacterium]|nr:DUF1629 domain-containing protein [Paracoccaceae bacterium]